MWKMAKPFLFFFLKAGFVILITDWDPNGKVITDPDPEQNRLRFLDPSESEFATLI